MTIFRRDQKEPDWVAGKAIFFYFYPTKSAILQIKVYWAIWPC